MQQDKIFVYVYLILFYKIYWSTALALIGITGTLDDG
jgi:hypothetical protein